MLYIFRYQGHGEGWTLLIEARDTLEAHRAIEWFDMKHECGRFGGSPELQPDEVERYSPYNAEWALDTAESPCDFGMLETGVTLIRPRRQQEAPWGLVDGEWEAHTISDDLDEEWEIR